MMLNLQTINWECTNKSNINDISRSIADSDYELSSAEIIKVLDECTELGTQYFNIFGGEPLLRKDLFNILDHARDLGLNTEVTTNGTLLTPEVIKKFEKSKVNSVNVRLNFADEAGLDCWNRSPGIFSRVLESFKNLYDSNLIFGIDAAVMRYNVGEINNFMELALKVKANYIKYTPILGLDQPSIEQPLPPDQWASVITSIFDCAEAHVNHIVYNDYKQMSFNKDLFDCYALQCPAGLSWMDITPNGRIRGCRHMPVEMDTVTDKSLKEIWFNNFHDLRNIHNNRLDNNCKTCPMDGCKGGCVSERIARGGLLCGNSICIRDLFTEALGTKSTLASRKIFSGSLDAIYVKNQTCLRNLPIFTYTLKNN